MGLKKQRVQAGNYASFKFFIISISNQIQFLETVQQPLQNSISIMCAKFYCITPKIVKIMNNLKMRGYVVKHQYFNTVAILVFLARIDY